MIELWEGIGFGAIISFPSGVHYSNQAGGTSCLHPTLEGVYVPLSNDYAIPTGPLLGPEKELFAYFEGPKHRGTGATGGLDEADAAFIESVLARWRLSATLEVDRARLLESHEAWVWATVIAETGSPFSGLGPYPRPAILTWSNSD
jgi:hypothetical protein